MAVYTKGNETKKRLVILTYQMLLEKDASSLTIREIASQNKCSAAAVYRHFDSLEELLAVASVRFLDSYMREYGKLLDSETSLLKSYINGWKLFNQYAFDRPDIYFRLFWGNENGIFEDAIQEYFELFPFPENEKYAGHFYTLLFINSMQKRDFLLLHRLVNANLLTEEDAEYFSKTNPLIVKGMLLDSMDKALEERRAIKQECDILVEQNFSRRKIQ